MSSSGNNFRGNNKRGGNKKKKPIPSQSRVDLLMAKERDLVSLNPKEVNELREFGKELYRKLKWERGLLAEKETGGLHEQRREIQWAEDRVTAAAKKIKEFDTFFRKLDPLHKSFELPQKEFKRREFKRKNPKSHGSKTSESPAHVEVPVSDDLKTDANPPAHAEVAEVEVVPDTWEDVVLDTRAPDEVPDEWDAEL